MNSQNENAGRGFDDAVGRREQDHLNRWPFAREIYSVASTGPKNWSVRIGVYGEWGTGKTSVLKLIDAMANEEKHIVVWFDPWEHSSKDSLWRSFILKVYKRLEDDLGGVAQAGQARRKDWLLKISDVVQAMAKPIGTVNQQVGEVASAGLDLLKKHFRFSKDDLSALQESLGDRRIIVLIDDLDRTAPELVPEILFALKELMDIPGFAFVCAFDPVVVGQVLGDYHKGFGDGLKFLEKIIDYPRWLPLPASDGLVKLALADRKAFCEFVPEQVIRDAVPLLPENPRAIRQFIRLLALLKWQIGRHYDYELRWPVIVAANVIKVRHPRIAHGLLDDREFWKEVGMLFLTARDKNEKQERNKTIDEHLKRVLEKERVDLNAAQMNQLKEALKVLCAHVHMWTGSDAENISYQMSVGEAPHAVTWREFDEFISVWLRDSNVKTAKEWIAKHAHDHGCSQLRVYQELFGAALQKYATTVNRADQAFAEAEKAPLVKEAEALMNLLECLVFNLGDLDKEEKKLGVAEMEQLFDKIKNLTRMTSSVHAMFESRNESLLLKIVEKWNGDLTTLINLIQPFVPMFFSHMEGPKLQALHKKLSTAVIPKYARQIANSFREHEFGARLWPRESKIFAARQMVLSSKSYFWNELRSEVVKIFAEAKDSRAIQENVHQLLYLFSYLLRDDTVEEEKKEVEQLVSNQQILEALWNAATATPLGIASVVRLSSLPSQLKNLGVSIILPPWWDSTLTTIHPQSEAKPENCESSETV